MIKTMPLFAATALMAVSPLACAQFDALEKPAPKIGVQAGVYYFTDSTMRDLFGDAVPQVGLAVLGSQPHKKSRFFTNVNVIGTSKNGNKLLLVPFMAGYEAQLIQDDYATTIPYVRAEAGYAYYDYSVDAFGGHMGAKRGGPTGAVEAGVSFNDRINLAVRYNWFQKFDGLNFNGLQLSLSYALAKF